MKDNTAALETLQKGTEADVKKEHTRELESNMSKIMYEIQNERSTESDEQTYQRAMRDPEVAEIMSDPIM
jgi:stress-induced-phosphoprotein 1